MIKHAISDVIHCNILNDVMCANSLISEASDVFRLTTLN